ncbi:MAG: DUF1398 family protein [Polyangiales bacterium]
MDEATKAVVRGCSTDSDAERASFPEVVARLAAANVERYHADLWRATKTYYQPSGASDEVACRPVETRFAEAFSPGGVEAAVRASQRGEIRYREFCERIAQAGCVGYFVSLAGRRVVYYGRTGETHVELFPGAT